MLYQLETFFIYYEALKWQVFSEKDYPHGCSIRKSNCSLEGHCSKEIMRLGNSNFRACSSFLEDRLKWLARIGSHRVLSVAKEHSKSRIYTIHPERSLRGDPGQCASNYVSQNTILWMFQTGRGRGYVEICLGGITHIPGLGIHGTF